MTTYTDTIKLDSLPLFEPTTGFKPVVKVIYYEEGGEGEDRPTSGQIYPRSL